jgi:2-oxoglutarate ferredoxin oxidoreductase subunit gamma
MRVEIRLAGFGGQGIILAGYILGKAAAIYDGRHAVMVQSYGPEARGGACATELIVSDEPIDFPLITRPDILVLLSQEAFRRYYSSAHPSGIVVLERDLIKADELDREVHRLPCVQLAETLGNRIVANVIALGYIASLTDAISRTALEESVRTSVKERAVPLNLTAFAAGYDYASKRAEVVA